MDTINRLAFVVTPKQPFLDWVNALDPNFSHKISANDCPGGVYLIAETETDQEADDDLALNFDLIFETELESWWTDEALWPQNRTYPMFREWFDIRRIDMVWDLEDKPIIKGD